MDINKGSHWETIAPIKALHKGTLITLGYGEHLTVQSVDTDKGTLVAYYESMFGDDYVTLSVIDLKMNSERL